MFGKIDKSMGESRGAQVFGVLIFIGLAIFCFVW